MIPANIREAMERMKGDQWTGNDAVVVAKFAVPILERVERGIGRCEQDIAALFDSRQINPSENAVEWVGVLTTKLCTLKTILGAT